MPSAAPEEVRTLLLESLKVASSSAGFKKDDFFDHWFRGRG
jgi:hypothetical protein